MKSPDFSMKYVIKYKSPGHSVWQRSGNRNSQGVSNWTTTYNSLAEAEEEARYQQRLMGPKGFTYKAVALLN